MRMRQIIGVTSSFLLVLTGGYFSSARIESTHAQGATSAVGDKFATTILHGGCSIRLASTGRTVKTEGSGGACPTTFKAMMDHLAALNPDPRNTRVFVVSELEDHPSAAKNYRFFVSFKAQSGDQDGDIFLSVLGPSARIADGSMEAMGFDHTKKAYAFYRLESDRWVQEGDGTMVPSDSLPGTGDMKMACQACHSTGAPLMKELHDSWANWHSRWDRFKKPNTNDPQFEAVFDKIGLTIADSLEPTIIAGTKASAIGRVDRAISAKQTGLMLRQAMCDVGEPNLVGVHERSSARFGDIATSTSRLPGAILLNQIFAAPGTGSGPEQGLEGNLQMNLPDFKSVISNSAAYVAAARKLGVTFKGISGLNDAKFAWVVCHEA